MPSEVSEVSGLAFLYALSVRPFTYIMGEIPYSYSIYVEFLRNFSPSSPSMNCFKEVKSLFFIFETMLLTMLTCPTVESSASSLSESCPTVFPSPSPLEFAPMRDVKSKPDFEMVTG